MVSGPNGLSLKAEDLATPPPARQNIKLQTPTNPGPLHVVREERLPLARTWSSPPTSPTYQRISGKFGGPSMRDNGMLTPPETPVKSQKRASSADGRGLASLGHVASDLAGLQDVYQIDGSKEDQSQTRAGGSGLGIEEDLLKHKILTNEQAWNAIKHPRKCYEQYSIREDPSRGLEEFGRGGWSIVYKADQKFPDASTFHNTGLPSPPNSPRHLRRVQAPKVYAVKVPGRRDAQPVLEKEARILTYLQHTGSYGLTSPKHEDFLVHFYGYDEPTSALVLEAVPLTLAQYSEQQATLAASTRKRTAKPGVVVGMDIWLHFAAHLTAGLAFLHSRAVIHADIKPSNILLRSLPNTPFPAPIYCDFSSAHVAQPGTDPDRTSAWTTEFTAPEILAVCARGTDALATPAADVFALAVSLLTPATGSRPYPAASVFQMRHMAMQGTPLVFALGRPKERSAEYAVVARVLEAAVRKDEKLRLGADEWCGVVRKVQEE